MKSIVAALFVGFIFALGLGISGMTQPQKVISFLDIFGAWDPSLMFVMMGALAVHAVVYPLIVRRRKPLLAAEFQIPKKREIDFKLIGGAMLFGLGWGLAGYCPAPALTAAATLALAPLAFVFSMLVGMWLFLTLERAFALLKT